MNDNLKCQFGDEFAPWQSGAAFNAYRTYTFINNSAFYAMVPAYYRLYMQRFVQNWLWWYDGWVPYFHDADKGIMSTRIATSLVNRISKKVIGSRLMFKNAGKMSDSEGSNLSRTSIADWSDKHNFDNAVKQAARFAAAAGTSLLKLNKSSDDELWAEAVRFDRFLPTVDAGTGKLRSVKSFLMTTVEQNAKDFAQAYNLVERRYFGDYTGLDGKTLRNVPLAEYAVYRAGGSVTQGVFTLAPSGNGEGERIAYKSLPKSVKDAIYENYGRMALGNPIPLPFENSLGCELVNWTPGVSGIPHLPFGESVLATITPLLQQYDYFNSAMATDMYIGRGRVLAPMGIEGVKDARGIAPSFNAGLDDMLYQKIPYINPEDQKPLPLQFDLRAESWEKIRNILIEGMAVHIGISPATIAAFLNDVSARTAREVSTEENETANYVADTRAIIEAPINNILGLVQKYHGLPDKVVVRWSQAGLSNQYMSTEMMVSQYNAGLVSLKDAISNLNPDDDEDQIEIKVKNARTDYDNRQQMTQPFADDEKQGGYFGDEQEEGNNGSEEAEPANADD